MWLQTLETAGAGNILSPGAVSVLAAMESPAADGTNGTDGTDGAAGSNCPCPTCGAASGAASGAGATVAESANAVMRAAGAIPGVMQLENMFGGHHNCAAASISTGV